MTPPEINEAHAVLHGELATAYGPLDLDPAIAIGEALSLLAPGDFAALDFPKFDQRNYLKLYSIRDRPLMQWLKLTYDRNRIQLRYEVI